MRPTKKQRELLEFISSFIAEHGYSPSYREIMAGLSYTSVATVSLHVNNLIKRGHLVKREHSARSLEVVKQNGSESPVATVSESQEKWLINLIGQKFDDFEQDPTDKKADELFVLVGCLKVLGLSEAANSFMPRLPKP